MALHDVVPSADRQYSATEQAAPKDDRWYNTAVPRRTPPPPRGPQLELAGELGVAFVNTAGARPDNRQLGVESFDDFVTWSLAVGTVSAHQAQRLRRRVAERPAEAAFALVATLRAALARIFLAIQQQEPADPADLVAFNQALAESSLAPRLAATETGAAWTWAGGEDALDSLLSPVLHSAHEVMTFARGRPQCDAYSSRNADATGSRAARMAGKSPPTRPISRA